MSLDSKQMRRTGEDLRRYSQATGCDAATLAGWLGVPEARVDDVLHMRVSDPVLTWLLRDALDDEAKRLGVEVAGWSVLTSDARVQAQSWFALRELPPRP